MTQSLVRIIANLETSLVSKLEPAGVTFDLVSNLDQDGNTLGAGTYGFTINEGQANEEHLVGTLSGSTVTVTLRNIKRNDGSTAQTGESHRRGDSVKITNFPAIKRMYDLLAGETDFDSATPLKYDGNPTLTDDAHFATKKYVDDVAIAGSPDMTVTVKGIAEEATEAEIDADTGAGGTGARLAINPATLATSRYGVRLPTAAEKLALPGTGGTLSATNKYVTQEDSSGDFKMPSGMISPYAGASAPTGWLDCDGSLVSALTYVDLFDIITNLYGDGAATAFTADAGTDFITDVAHGLSDNDVVYFTNSDGALPTGLSPITKYFVINKTDDTYQVALTSGGAAIDITDTGTGTHFWHNQFNLPDMIGRMAIGTKTTNKTVIEDCEDAWDELVDGDVTSTLDTTDFKVGSGSVKLVAAAGLGAGDIMATEVIAPSATIFHGKTHITLWMKSTIALSAGDLALLLDDTASCASPLETIDIPAISANEWTRVYLPLANPGTDNTIISIGIKQVVDKGAFTLHVDDFAIGEAMELGLKGGEETHTQTEGELVTHSHQDNVGSNVGGSGLPGAVTTDSANLPFEVGSTGDNRATPQMPPYLSINYIIKT